MRPEVPPARHGIAPQPRQYRRRLIPTRYSALAAIQAFMLVGAIAHVVWPPANEEFTALSLGLIPVLAVLMGFTETVARRTPWWGLEASLGLTWLLTAGLASTWAYGAGQVFIAFAMMSLTVYALYYLPRRHAVIHVVCMTAVYMVALYVKFGNPGAALFMLALIAMLSGTALLGASRANDRRERLLIDYAGDVVFHSAHGVVQWISPSVRGELGWDPDDLIGSSIHRLWHTDDYDRALEIRDLAYAGTAGAGVFRFLTGDGDYAWIEITFKPYSENGEQGAVGTMRNVSDRVAAERALIASEQDYRQLAQMEAQQRKQIADLDEVKSRLFQNISHELRTPLTLIQAPLQDLLHDKSDMAHMSDRRRADLEAAAKAASGLQRLVDGLLDVARGQAGELKVTPEPTNLASVTRESVEMFRSRTDQAGLDLIVTTVGFPPLVLIDREMWLKILTNLVSNAVKFTARGEVSVELRFVRGTVELLVADSGTGILEEDLPGIFTRFQQASSRPVRQDSGSGIGLALVAEWVRSAGGTVNVDSAWGVGTTVIVRIPAERCDVVTVPVARPDAVEMAAEEALPRGEVRGRILLVEDHADLRTYVDRLLQSCGWTVTSVASAEEGQGLVAGHDLLVTDVMLPGAMSGLDLVRWIRDSELSRDIPVVVLTARSGLDSLLDALAAGSDAFITKPFDPNALISRVAAHLELARLRESESIDGSSGSLTGALAADRLTGNAVAILMTAEGISPDRAFTRLSDVSQRSGRSLTDLASDVVLSGRLASPG